MTGLFPHTKNYNNQDKMLGKDISSSLYFFWKTGLNMLNLKGV